MSARRSRSRRTRAGFTLLEMMVALCLGALVVATMYTLGGASSRAFQTQQRISQLQLQTRLALERVRRDIAATGFGASPDSALERTCFTRGVTTQLRAVGLVNGDATATTALSTMPGYATAATQGDRLTLMGNFATSDTYLIANTGSGGPGTILLQSNWQAFRRSFAANPLGTSVDTQLFQDVFAPGRLVHVVHPRGFHFFSVIQSSNVDSSGTTPSVSIAPPLPALDECNFVMCVGCQVTPVMMVEYGIDTADRIAPSLVPRDVAVTGTNTVLYRRELDPTTGNPLANVAPRVILEWAVNFDVHVTTITPPSTALPALLPSGASSATPGGHDRYDAIPAGQEARVRSLQVAIAARTPETDPSFPVPYAGATRAATEPLTSFRVFTDGRPGSSRVRTAVAEFVLENLAVRGL